MVFTLFTLELHTIDRSVTSKPISVLALQALEKEK